jgi:hypothetical protein
MLWRESFSRGTKGLVCDRQARWSTKAHHDRNVSGGLACRSSTEARKIIRDAQLGLLRADDKAASPTLGETVPLFIQLYAKPKNRGWKESERLLGRFQSLFSKSLVDLTRGDIVRVLDQIVASGTPYRANRVLAALKKLMSWALDRGMIDLNPIAGLKPPHKEQARERVLSALRVLIGESLLIKSMRLHGFVEPS